MKWQFYRRVFQGVPQINKDNSLANSGWANATTADLLALGRKLQNLEWRPADWWMGTFILMIAAVLRFYALGSEPLWLDEGYSWWDSSQSFADIWGLVPQCDPLPPLYPFMLKIWSTVFGDSSFALRAFSAATSVVATGFVILTGREISNRIGWMAGLVFATAPFQIEFAHEARPYSLLCLGAAILTFGAIRVFRTGPGRNLAAYFRGWCALIAGSLIMLWTNNTAIFGVISFGLIAAWLLLREQRLRPMIRPLIVAAIIIGILWLPYLPTYLQQAEGIASDFWIPKPDSWRVGNELRFVVGLGSFNILWCLTFIWSVGLGLLWWRGHRREAIVLGGMFILPVAINFLVSVTIKPIFIARAFIGIAPAFAIGIAVALAFFKQRRVRVIAVLAVACLQLVPAWTILTQKDRKEPWDDIAMQMVSDARANGGQPLVLMVPNELSLPLNHALEEAHMSLPISGIPDAFPAPGLTARYPSGKCTPSVLGQDLGKLKQAVKGHDTVLFVTRRGNVYDPKDQIQIQLMGLGLRQIGIHEYKPGGLIVHTFVQPGNLFRGKVASAPAITSKNTH
ncbi:glycosyltransferase family 39 protein [Ampullimonas aquatilis]|uniref:glycosyltransferase family 39 protein n=1 Tax=Ampullimonas aquatilis TaxID=1341549 RepID=UPI003C75D639